ncbi:hypothetical protein FQZ97_630420 [compost metagenome]
MDELAQHPDLLQQIRSDQQLFAAGARLVQVDRRVDALFGQAALEVDFGVAGALELFVDDFVHAAAGFDQRRAQDGQRTAFFQVAGRAEEALGTLQGVGIHAAGQHLAGGRHHGVVGARQTGDRVQQDHDVFLHFDQALGLLDDHFRDLHVAGGGFVEGRRHHFAAHRALHFGHFLGALVHQQDDHDRVGVVRGDGVRDVLHHHRLAGLGAGDDQAALAHADGGEDVQNAAREVFLALDVAFQAHGPVRMQRRQVFEHDAMLDRFGRHAVDLVHLHQGEIALAILGRAHFAFDRVAGMQVEAADLRRRDIDIVRAGQIRGLGRAQEAEAIGEDFKHAVAEDLLALFGAPFHDGEHQFLLAQAVGVLDFQAGGHFQQLRDVQRLQFVEVHRGECWGKSKGGFWRRATDGLARY